MDTTDFDIKIISLKDKVFRFAKRLLKNNDDAEDATQDMYEKIWKMRDKLSEYNNLEAFLIKSTKNLCLDRLKHEKVKQEKLKEIQYLQSTHTNNPSDNDMSQKIKILINQLPEKQKMVIHLRDVEGYNFEEIAEILDTDINAVRMNLSRARKSVRENITKTMNYGLQGN